MSEFTFGRRYGDAIWFIICEHDTDNPFKSDGAIIMEQYTKQDSDSVKERAKSLANSGKYGRVWMLSADERNACRVLPESPEVTAGQTVRTTGPVDLNKIEPN